MSKKCSLCVLIAPCGLYTQRSNFHVLNSSLGQPNMSQESDNEAPPPLVRIRASLKIRDTERVREFYQYFFEHLGPAACEHIAQISMQMMRTYWPDHVRDIEVDQMKKSGLTPIH